MGSRKKYGTVLQHGGCDEGGMTAEKLRTGFVLEQGGGQEETGTLQSKRWRSFRLLSPFQLYLQPVCAEGRPGKGSAAESPKSHLYA